MLDEMFGPDSEEVSNCIFGQDQRFVPMIFMDKRKVGGYGELL